MQGGPHHLSWQRRIPIPCPRHKAFLMILRDFQMYQGPRLKQKDLSRKEVHLRQKKYTRLTVQKCSKNQKQPDRGLAGMMGDWEIPLDLDMNHE